MSARTDTELLTLLRENDVQAFRELYDAHWPELFSIAVQKLPGDDAADIVQDLFLQIWKKRHELSINGSFEAYLFVSLQNRIFSFYKKQLAERRRHLAVAGQTTVVSNVSPQEALHAKELHALVHQEIQAMPARMRTVFELSRQQNLSSQAIASQLSLSGQTVRNQISAALKRIKRRLQMHL